MVCDIQGVGTFYTDPQIHTHDGEGFGAGNLGPEGLRRFLRTHRHSLMCEKLGAACKGFKGLKGFKAVNIGALGPKEMATRPSGPWFCPSLDLNRLRFIFGSQFYPAYSWLRDEQPAHRWPSQRRV